MRTSGGAARAVAFAVILVVVLGGAAAAYYLGDYRSAATSGSSSGTSQAAPVETYRTIAVFPHDQGAFTEGLVFYNGSLFESTGLYGSSSLRRVDLNTGQVLQTHDLPNGYFGEGITVFNGKIIQLTYQEKTGFVYDLSSFALLQTFSYPDQGWGLTQNGTELIMSDGTANLYFLNPETFQRVGEITVRDGTTPITNLNELEYINGSVFANVWLTNRIVVIDPASGQVTAWIDLTCIENVGGCYPHGANDVLNGIAYDQSGNRLFVTGKTWPNLFEIQIVPPRPS